MKPNPIETINIQQLLEKGDKQAIIEWFRNKEKKEAAALAAASNPTPATPTIHNTYHITQAAPVTASNGSDKAAKANWYDHAKCCCTNIVKQMQITDWLLLLIAFLLFILIIKK